MRFKITVKLSYRKIWSHFCTVEYINRKICTYYKQKSLAQASKNTRSEISRTLAQKKEQYGLMTEEALNLKSRPGKCRVVDLRLNKVSLDGSIENGRWELGTTKY